MKRVLITGANSYVGSNVEKWLMREPEKYYVETLDMKDPNWRDYDFSKFNVVFHVAGIVHIKEKKTNLNLYKIINSDLAYNTAVVSKKNGVEQFIYISTMSVYNDFDRIVNKNSVPNPISEYGKSKLDGESRIAELQSDQFKVIILRPPMIYGKNCPGNYSSLSKYVKRIKIVPVIDNIKSFIYIDNLSYFIEQIIEKGLFGVYHPHNLNNISTSKLAETIAKVNKIKLLKIRIPKFIIRLISVKKLHKVFMSHYYDIPQDRINQIQFEESIHITESI